MTFAAKLTKKNVLVLLMSASLVTCLLGPRFSGRIREAVQPIFAPLGDGGMYLATTLKTHLGDITAAGLSAPEARRLRQANRELRGQLLATRQKLADLYRQQEAERRLLFGPMHDFPCELIAARVVGADSLPYGATRVVNVGRDRGAVAGASVTTRRLLTDCSKALLPRLATVTGNALVGRLTETGAFTACVQLVIDRGFRLRARVHRVINPRHPRQVTVFRPGGALVEPLSRRNNAPIDIEAQGDGVSGLEATDVPADYQIRPGDWVVTCGDEAFLPAEIRIGQVDRVRAEPMHRGYVTLHVAPCADLATLRNVFIVVPLGASARPGRGGTR